MIKPSQIIPFLLLLSLNLQAQYVYEEWDNIPVIRNGKTLEYPFLGGLNAGQFNELDLNSDGIMDLVILDRSGSRISPFINRGTSNQVDYEFAPQYRASFPTMRNWLITGDYNCDGKMDLFVGSSNIEVYENTTGSDGKLSFTLITKVRSAYNKYEFPNDTNRSTVNAGSVNKPAIYDVGNDGDLDLLFFDQGGIKMEYHRNLSVEETGSCGLLFERRSKCWGDFTESSLTGDLFLDSCRFGDLPNPEDEEEGNSEAGKGLKHAGSTISGFDFYNNGGTDLIIGDVSGTSLTALYNADTIAPYTNSHFYKKDSQFPRYDTPIYLPLFPAAYFMDINNDQKKDMLVTTNSNSFGSYTKTSDNILFYKNTGTDTSRFEFQNQSNLFFDEMLDHGLGSNPSFFDYNKDGLLDLIVGNQGYLNASGNSIEAQLALYKNVGTASNPAFELVDNNYLNLPGFPLDLNNNGPTQNVQLTFGDLDNDGDEDLIIGDYNGDLHYFIDTSAAGNEAQFKLEAASFERISSFTVASPLLYDIDQDGLLDLIVGQTAGRLEYYENLGSPQVPQFTLKVKSIKWLNGDTIRYELERNPNLAKLSIGKQVDVNYSNNNNNGVFQDIARIDSNGLYIDLIHPFRDDATDDELSTNAIIDYSNKKWGNVDIIAIDFNRDSDPVLYEEEGELKMIIASRHGNLYFYDSLSQNLNSGSFNLVDSNFLNLKQGFFINIGAADLNQDGKIDLAIGNEAGGLIILKALHGVGISESPSTEEKSTVQIFPNPSNGQVQVKTQKPGDKILRVYIYDVNGRLILNHVTQGKQVNLNLESYPSGMYIIQVQSQEGFSSNKLILKP